VISERLVFKSLAAAIYESAVASAHVEAKHLIIHNPMLKL